jgi:hypothetical protein
MVMTCRDNNGYPMGRDNRREHVHVAERALGKRLPKRAIVHHVNEIKHDNRPANLVICEDHLYHKLLHRSPEGAPRDRQRQCREMSILPALDAADRS